ncbi:hypothetical protein BAUCODRAFT_391526 [Baudoinia panamericana UAMH 10762]|uniref:Uncharacterized protein n=1 Tax=Baudoinia panamericana (strain UAMH 10762) TaxID=717646 RepID=M2NIB0_BAUPA|nr:uncharacterized protein BAUCODRAFT_391526 [Baudoinia panamericana UAMH 10762]EMC99104.1 hypothetical protein BAUCODRAFT_391526 [Baudoinia panamericana UAMH 10762]
MITSQPSLLFSIPSDTYCSNPPCCDCPRPETVLTALGDLIATFVYRRTLTTG